MLAGAPSHAARVQRDSAALRPLPGGGFMNTEVLDALAVVAATEGGDDAVVSWPADRHGLRFGLSLEIPVPSQYVQLWLARVSPAL